MMRRALCVSRRAFATAADGAQLIIFDTTLRDGEQSPGCTLNTKEKIVVARQLSRLGVDVCEAGFPIASDGDFEAVASIAEQVGPLTEGRVDSVPMTICGLSRATQKDIGRCFDAIKYAPKHRIHTFLATSDIHLKHKLQIDRDECVKRAVAAVAYAASLTPDVEFSPEDAGRSDPEFLCRVLSAVIEAGATTLNIPDTVGYNTPEMYGGLIKYLVENTKGADKVVFSTHCHNDLGLATANTLAGVLNGARQVEVTINGIGERAGNTSLEEITMIADTHKNLNLRTNIVHDQIFRSSQMVSGFTGMAVQANKAVVGANAFAHESGIHQDGMLKNRETYEIMTPTRVGVQNTSLVLGKHSGRNAFFSRLDDLGYTDFSDSKRVELFARFKSLADKKKVVTENDLHALVQEEEMQGTQEELYQLRDFTLSTGRVNTATVELANLQTGEILSDAATGNGPVDACANAINRIVACENLSLCHFEMKSFVTEGSDTDSIGECILRLKDADGRLVMGRGLDVNVVKSTLLAYINAINKYTTQKAPTDKEMQLKEATP
eukprot:TRINITY_DN32401_c1_g2_i1.p1 TRINITY_DN32401_c1_g2~~TRINITY_DN32401_c1_g2_i1.p1  ORF type:complete len:591 (+),score=244.24 TRINITY_DN32401_c1_g2_i1:122-1774(+)